jgi:hypothetical protein
MVFLLIQLSTMEKNGSFQKRSTLSTRRKFLPTGGGRGEKIVSDNSKCIRTSEGGVEGLTSYFLRGGMDVFWNDPIQLPDQYFS